MQGVSQHAGHTLHHHLVRSLKVSRGWGLGQACLGAGYLGVREEELQAEGEHRGPPPSRGSTKDGFISYASQPTPPRSAAGSGPGFLHTSPLSLLPTHRDPTPSLFRDLPVSMTRNCQTPSPSPAVVPTSFTTFLREVFMSSLLETCSISSGGKTCHTSTEEGHSLTRAAPEMALSLLCVWASQGTPGLWPGETARISVVLGLGNSRGLWDPAKYNARCVITRVWGPPPGQGRRSSIGAPGNLGQQEPG